MARIEWKSKEQLDAEAARNQKTDTDSIGELLIAERLKNIKLQSTVDKVGQQLIAMQLDNMRRTGGV